MAEWECPVCGDDDIIVTPVYGGEDTGTCSKGHTEPLTPKQNKR